MPIRYEEQPSVPNNMILQLRNAFAGGTIVVKVEVPGDNTKKLVLGEHGGGVSHSKNAPDIPRIEYYREMFSTEKCDPYTTSGKTRIASRPNALRNNSPLRINAYRGFSAKAS